MECYCWSTVDASSTPFINAGMVFCDRHYGGINYPVGGVGTLPRLMAEGIAERGGRVEYRAKAVEILTEPCAAGSPDAGGRGGFDGRRAVGVRLADGRVYRGKTIISNATRWDTFEGLMPGSDLPRGEAKFRERYAEAPSFLSCHLGVDASALPAGVHCHHIVLESWDAMYAPRGTLFLSIPTALEGAGVAPPGKHLVHAFTPDWADAWAGLSPAEYRRRKEEAADAIVDRLDALWPGFAGKVEHREVGTPRTHRKFLGRRGGSYGPIPRDGRPPLGMLSMPFNRTGVRSLYCVGDSTFPGQGVNAVVFSGFGCAHRVLADLGRVPVAPVVGGVDLDRLYTDLMEDWRAKI